MVLAARITSVSSTTISENLRIYPPYSAKSYSFALD